MESFLKSLEPMPIPVVIATVVGWGLVLYIAIDAIYKAS
jgi:hypothetical protein